jgi:hypothetical protein
MQPAPLVARRAPEAATRCTPADYTLEAKLLRRYRTILHQVDQPEMDRLVLAALGEPKVAATTSRRNVQEEREKRLDEEVPELLRMLRPAEQRHLAPLLLEANDLAAFAKEVLALNGRANNLYRREEENPLKDDYLFKAAGMGKLSRALSLPGWIASQKVRGLPTGGPPLELTPPPVRAALRSKQKPKRRPPLVLRGQCSIEWPPVSAVAVKGGGL